MNVFWEIFWRGFWSQVPVVNTGAFLAPLKVVEHFW